MRKTIIWLLTIAALSVVSCGTLTVAQRQALQSAVQDSLRSRHYTIDVDMMYPQRGPAENVTSNWSLEVRGDTLVSYLPYIGVADFVPPGGGKGMNFTAPIDKYSTSSDAKGRTQVDMKVKNEEERMDIHITVESEGQSYIDVYFQTRDRIGYGGTLDADY